MIRLIVMAIAGYAAYRYLTRDNRDREPDLFLPSPEPAPERPATPF
jgi:hypothetical protein